MNAHDYIIGHYREALLYLKARFPMYHQSNFFFRDIQYGLDQMLREKGYHLSYTEAEGAARVFTGELEKQGIFKRIDQQTWLVNYPEFATPVKKQPPPAPAPKPRAVPPGEKNPAGGQGTEPKTPAP